jgi:hypothetical protein
VGASGIEDEEEEEYNYNLIPSPVCYVLVLCI